MFVASVGKTKRGTTEDFQELRSALSEIYNYADRGLDILRSLED